MSDPRACMTIIELREEVERLQERLQRIEQWCKAYPRTVFIEPTKKQWKIADETLAAHKADDCPSLTAISGSNMRHVVEGLMAQAKDWEKSESPRHCPLCPEPLLEGSGFCHDHTENAK